MTESSDVLYRYKAASGEFLPGVPARDVTLADWDQMEEQAKTDLMAHAKMSDGLYDQVGKVAEVRQATTGGKKKAKKKIQVDPDPNIAPTGTRTNADTLATGQAMPAADEPLASGIGGFQQADTGGPGSNKEG